MKLWIHYVHIQAYALIQAINTSSCSLKKFWIRPLLLGIFVKKQKHFVLFLLTQLFSLHVEKLKSSNIVFTFCACSFCLQDCGKAWVQYSTCIIPSLLQMGVCSACISPYVHYEYAMIFKKLHHIFQVTLKGMPHGIMNVWWFIIDFSDVNVSFCHFMSGVTIYLCNVTVVLLCLYNCYTGILLVSVKMYSTCWQYG